MYFNFKKFLQMSLFIEQANLCLPTTKTTETRCRPSKGRRCIPDVVI